MAIGQILRLGWPSNALTFLLCVAWRLLMLMCWPVVWLSVIVLATIGAVVPSASHDPTGAVGMGWRWSAVVALRCCIGAIGLAISKTGNKQLKNMSLNMAVIQQRTIMAGAPFGNNNAIKNKLWSDTLRRAIAQDRGDRVRQAAERLLDEAAKGEPWAIKELADRLDGRSVQANSFEADGGTVTELVVRWLDPVLTLDSDC
jgi:hypothetical protein